MSPTVMLSDRKLARPRLQPAKVLILGLLAAFLSTSIPAESLARPVPDSFADLAEKTLPSVVNISTSQDMRSPFGEDENGEPALPPGIPDMFRDFFENRRIPPRRARSMGSGFIIDAQGIIITNNHVVEDADEIVVILDDGSELDAKVLGTDRRTDIAVIKVEPKTPLKALKFANSDDLRVGDWVMAVGNPFGLGGTVTAGIVSALGRNINAGPYDDFIQTDAAINQGNSGGPLFNMDGEVIGINSVIISRTGGNVGIGFAIPSKLAQRVIADLRQHGQVKRGWLGVGIQPVDEEMAESVGLETAEGVMVSNVMEGDPADKAGVKSGDVILEYNGQEVPDTRTLLRLVADTPEGRTVPITVWRDGRRKTLTVQVGEMKPDEEKPAPPAGEPGGPIDEGDPLETLGMTLLPLDDDARENAKVPEDVEGVIVSRVKPRSDAAEKGIRRGDVIVRVGTEDVASTADVSAAIKKQKDEGRKSVLLRLRRGENFIFIALKLEDDED